MKKIKLIFSVIICFALIYSASYAQNDIRVYVNGMRLNHDVILENDRTYVPLRAVSEALGAEVLWDDATRTVNINYTEDDAAAKIVSEASAGTVTILGNYSGSESQTYYSPIVHGSGVIYKSNGYIVTNAHVVKDIKNLTVVLSNGESLPGTVLLSDEDADLAIVKINKIGLTPIKITEQSEILSGTTAIVIGTPISLTMRNSVTKGIVSGSDVTLSDSYYKLLQTDAAINPGNSGGPVLNLKGELIGISSSKFVSPGIDNMAFAIPADTVKFVISQYEQFGYIKRPSLKFSTENSWEAKIGLPTTKGITVKNSSNGQILNGDIIIAVNGISVHSTADLNEAIKKTYNGNGLSFDVIRNSSSVKIEISE